LKRGVAGEEPDRGSYYLPARPPDLFADPALRRPVIVPNGLCWEGTDGRTMYFFRHPPPTPIFRLRLRSRTNGHDDRNRRRPGRPPRAMAGALPTEPTYGQTRGLLLCGGGLLFSGPGGRLGALHPGTGGIERAIGPDGQPGHLPRSAFAGPAAGRLFINPRRAISSTRRRIRIAASRWPGPIFAVDAGISGRTESLFRRQTLRRGGHDFLDLRRSRARASGVRGSSLRHPRRPFTVSAKGAGGAGGAADRRAVVSPRSPRPRRRGASLRTGWAPAPLPSSPAPASGADASSSAIGNRLIPAPVRQEGIALFLPRQSSGEGRRPPVGRRRPFVRAHLGAGGIVVVVKRTVRHACGAIAMSPREDPRTLKFCFAMSGYRR